MKKNINIFIILLFFLLCFDTNVKATDEVIISDLEYYNISYDFLNDNEYYVTYTFKPGENKNNFNEKYYFTDEHIYLDTIEHNLDNFELRDSVIENYAAMNFSLNESKEYYLKYKGFFDGNNSKTYGLCIKTISNSPKNNKCDNEDALSVYSFELNLYHPEKINYTKEKIINNGHLILNNEGESFQYLGGDKYEKGKYYESTIYKELILKSEIDQEKKHNDLIEFKILIFITTVFIIIIIISSIKLRNDLKKSNENNTTINY